ncbi:hypothetical protein chiPu_0025775 [Chiloscyllium punctatum]|uniref:Uncharacterized protein n=1 Tax=Chiloscyllium punctatum TaxID=137246 RepID=A0A401TG87_CHIPU|nr:hypothetical protein [Chiloscyllium punctatum]
MVTSPPRPARTPAPLVRTKDGAPSLPHRDAAERKTEGVCTRPRVAPTLPGAEQRNGLEREPLGEPREGSGSRRALPGDAGRQQHSSTLGPKILETLGQFGVRRVEAPGQRREEEEEEEKGALELPCPPLSAAELLAPGSMFEGGGSEDAPSLLGDGEHPFDAIDLDIVSVLSSPNLLACGGQGDCPVPPPAAQGEIPQPGAAVPERRGRQRGGGASEGEEEDEEDEDDDLDHYYNFARTVVTEEVMEQLASECFGLDSAEVPTIDQLDGVDDSDGGGGEGGGAEEGRAPPSPPQPHQAPPPPSEEPGNILPSEIMDFVLKNTSSPPPPPPPAGDPHFPEPPRIQRACGGLCAGSPPLPPPPPQPGGGVVLLNNGGQHVVILKGAEEGPTACPQPQPPRAGYGTVLLSTPGPVSLLQPPPPPLPVLNLVLGRRETPPPPPLPPPVTRLVPVPRGGLAAPTLPQASPSGSPDRAPTKHPHPGPLAAASSDPVLAKKQKTSHVWIDPLGAERKVLEDLPQVQPPASLG